MPSATLSRCVLTPARRTPRAVAYIRRVSTSAVNPVTELLLQLEWPTCSPIGPLVGRSTGTSARRIALGPHQDHQTSSSCLSGLLSFGVQVCIEHVAYCGLPMPRCLPFSIFDVRLCCYPMQPSPYGQKSAESLTTCATAPPQCFCRMSHRCGLWRLSSSRQIPNLCSTRCSALYARCIRMAEVLYYFLHLRYRATPCITFNIIDVYF
jgi:hypothetical protein